MATDKLAGVTTDRTNKKDSEKHDLVLYVMDGCPFCAKVEGFLAENRIEVPERSISTDKDAERTLVEVGGKHQVPCLFIDGKALYESGDIIAWLQSHALKN